MRFQRFKKLLAAWLITFLTRLKYTTWRSRLVDRLLIFIEAENEKSA